MVYSDYLKLHILFLARKGYKAPTICNLLKAENLSCTREIIFLFLKRYAETHSIARKPGSGRLSKLTAEIKALVEQQMQLDDETTAHQLHRLLQARGYKISLRTVLRCRRSLGWTFRGSAYCQLIHDVNKQKRLDWAKANLMDDFEDILWTDECSVQMESHRRFCCRKIGEAPKPKPKYAHC